MVQFPKPRYTQEQKRRLLELSDIMRDRAARIGPMHSWWEYITDVLRFLEGQETVLSFDAEGWIEKLTGMLTQKCIEVPKRRLPVKIHSSWSVEKGRWREGEGFVNRFTEHFAREIEMIVESATPDKGAILRFIGGPTGYESYYIADLQRPSDKPHGESFCICAGTINRWPGCTVAWADVVAFLKAEGFEMLNE